MDTLLVLLLTLLAVCGNSYNPSGSTYDPITHEYKSKRTHLNEQCGCLAGPAGPPGVPGAHGQHGQMGRDGRKGDKGDKGDMGNTGLQGLPGPPGPQGVEGKRGRKGVKGEGGPVGSVGPAGDKGERGHPGMIGEKGTKGDPAKHYKQVAFSVARSQRLGPVLKDTAISFDNVITNVGEGFDIYTSHFVCHTNGTYVFMTHILGQNNKDVYAWVMLNDKHKLPLHGDGRAGYGTGSQSIILQLKYEDNVWVQLSKDSGLVNDYTTFSGYLLFEE